MVLRKKYLDLWKKQELSKKISINYVNKALQVYGSRGLLNTFAKDSANGCVLVNLEKYEREMTERRQVEGVSLTRTLAASGYIEQAKRYRNLVGSLSLHLKRSSTLEQISEELPLPHGQLFIDFQNGNCTYMEK